ncbi:tetratricopeptide repeat protein [Fibrisoma montanum]|uniref:Tetratricopeptide repeat protein n=1 Tax=Fibrisoma montanum TaxID=2305895 RepID=A0A418LYG6_9BACT|nr:tetratricopeptide repeat protein [Fibrisoma montanum]RIV18423.1 tetratricopeptide repeat protein [Fibrisoma montanum]
MNLKNYNLNDFSAYLSSILFSVDYDFDKAESQLLNVYAKEPGNLLYVLLLCQLYQKKIEYCSLPNGDTMQDETELANYAQKGLDMLDKKPRTAWIDSDFQNQGAFLSYKANLEEALKAYQQAISINPKATDARIGLGVVYQKQKKWNAARAVFEQARRLDPNDFTLRCNLAEILIEQDQFKEAEEHLAFVRRLTDRRHLDALILSGRLYARLGDKARDNDDTVEADGRFDKAIRFLDKAAQADNYGDFSRKITPAESYTVHYLSGYCQIRQLQAREKKGSLIERFNFATESQRNVDKALVKFGRIPEYAHNSFEANQAVRQLKKYRKESSPLKEVGAQGLKGTVVVILAILVLISAQIFFLFRETSLVRAITQPDVVCYVQPSKVQPLLKLDSAGDVKLTQFARLTFNHPDSLIARWQRDMGETIRIERGWIENADAKPTPLLSEGFYVFITFASLLFIIAGLALPELTKLKVGSIELEKAKLETITTTTSLNITSSASAASSASR